MKYNNIVSRIVPLLLVCMVGDATLSLLYATKHKYHRRTVARHAGVRRPVLPVSQSREMVEHQIMKRQLQELATMPASIRVERLPRLLENLKAFPTLKAQDPQLEKQIQQAFHKAQGEITSSKGVVMPAQQEAEPKVAESREKEPENAEQVTTYVTSIIDQATALSKTASLFEQLGFLFKKADDIWVAHKEDPLEKLRKITSSHFHLNKTIAPMVEQQYFAQQENVSEIMQVLQEKDRQKASSRVAQEISYWLLFDLLHNHEKIDAQAIKTTMLPRATALFTFAFNFTKIGLIHREKLVKLSSQVRESVGAEVLKKFLKEHKQPQGMLPILWVIKQKDVFIKQLSPEQQAKVAPLLQEGSQLLEQVEGAAKDNEQAILTLQQTGFFAPEAVAEKNEGQQVPPVKKTGMSLGTKIAIGLMAAAVVGGGYMVYQEYAKQGDTEKNVSGAVKSAGGSILKQFTDAVDGVSSLFGRAKDVIASKFKRGQSPETGT
jgi:hypothetical protein